MPESSESIRFLLDGEVVRLESGPPTRTVLQVLREDLGRAGTKEGCAEGDCGACTVVMAEPAGDGRLAYRAVNSCIQFSPTLDAKALITVESLRRCSATRDGLHPVQAAMVKHHGSQCGFCTPGFVMSLFALYKTCAAPGRTAINDALAGNLCRCTGYRPIVDAAREMYRLGNAIAQGHDWLSAPAGNDSPAVRESEAAVAARLQALERPGRSVFLHARGRFIAPATADELATACLAHPEARILAGGTDVGLWVTKQHRQLGDLIYVGHVKELARITQSDTHIEIGAAVTFQQALPILAGAFPDMQEVLRRFGSPPIRNAATLGGNIANSSPIGDSMPALIALGATLTLRKGNSRRVLDLEDFFLGYQKNALDRGEFLEAIRIPRLSPRTQFRTCKISKRFDQDISALCGALAVTLDRGRVSAARIAFGGLAAVPRRAYATEAALSGAAWSAQSVERSAQCLSQDFTPITDMRASAEYRLRVARNLLHKFYLEVEQGEPLRLYALEATNS